MFPRPHYWWEAGAVWGGMIDYWAYTGDDSFVGTVQQALYAQMGPKQDFMNEARRGETVHLPPQSPPELYKMHARGSHHIPLPNLTPPGQ